VTRGAESERLRRRLVRDLETRGAIRSASVRDAFLAVPRERFLEDFAAREGLETVYRDEAIPIKVGPRGEPSSSSSQPAIMATMLEELELAPGMRVLEIGAGTGYTAALLAHLVGPRGRVVTVDLDPELVRRARSRLRGSRVHVVAGDGHEGVAERAPYNRIVVTASADEVPRAWFDQLEPGGRLVAPLRLSATGAQAIATLRKEAHGFRSVAVVAGGFMPLRRPNRDRPAPPPDAVLPLRWLAGDALRTLSPAARGRLFAVALATPRRVPLGVRAPAGALVLFLSLRVPRRRLVVTAPGFGVGAVGRDGRSLAIVEPSFAGRSPTVSSLHVFGADEAAEELLRHVREWVARGRPREGDLRIVVRYDADGRSRVRASWPRVETRPARE